MDSDCEYYFAVVYQSDCTFLADWEPEDHFTMTKVREFHSRKWKTTNSDYEIRIKPLPEEGWQEKLLQIFRLIVEKVKGKAKPGSVGRMVIEIDGLNYPINDRVSKVEEFNVKEIVENIAVVLNSNEEADISHGFMLNVIFTEM